MRVAIASYPGTTCFDETFRVYKKLLNFDEVYKLWHEEADLKSPDLVIVPGGYSYNDEIRPGALAKLSPLSGLIRRYAEKGGAVIGIGNGFQILCELGVLPGALLVNPAQNFLSGDVAVKVESTESSFSSQFSKDQVLKFQLASYYSRYWADKRTVKDMEDKGQVIFRYTNEFGDWEGDDPRTGSKKSIAGIISRHKKVLGLMVHPERSVEEMHSSTDGLKLLDIVL